MLRRRAYGCDYVADPVDEVQERAFGLCALLTLNGHVDLWGRSEVLGHQTRLHHQNEQRENDGDHDFLPPRILRHRDYLLLSSPFGDEEKIA